MSARIDDDGKTLDINKSCSFWVWEYDEAGGDLPSHKNVFAVDGVGTPLISFDDIPKIIEWLQGLERFRQ